MARWKIDPGWVSRAYNVDLYTVLAGSRDTAREFHKHSPPLKPPQISPTQLLSGNITRAEIPLARRATPLDRLLGLFSLRGVRKSLLHGALSCMEKKIRRFSGNLLCFWKSQDIPGMEIITWIITKAELIS